MSRMWLPYSDGPSVDFTGRFGDEQVGTVYTTTHRMERHPKYRVQSYFWIVRKTHNNGDVRYGASELVELQRLDEEYRFEALESVDISGALCDYESPLRAAFDRDAAMRASAATSYTVNDLWDPRDYEDEE